MKVFITKYALTKGIIEGEAKPTGIPGMIQVAGQPSWVYFRGEGRDWHRTREGALNRAEEIRIKKLKSLDNQIKKLSKLKFE
jgi:hypothetical protein